MTLTKHLDSSFFNYIKNDTNKITFGYILALVLIVSVHSQSPYIPPVNRKLTDSWDNLVSIEQH